MTGQELMRLALSRLAEGSPAKLVKELKLAELMDNVDPAAQVRRWANGKHELPYPIAMRLLESLGMLTGAPAAKDEAARPNGQSERPPDVLLAELAAAVYTMVQTHQTLVGDLAETHTRLQRLEAARPAASVRKPRKTGTG